MVLWGCKMKLDERELIFLKALCSFSHGHVTQDYLKSVLKPYGFNEAEFKSVKMKFLFNGSIGIVYGNITVEKQEIRGLVEDFEMPSLES